MGELSYDRCPNDDSKASSATIGYNPETGKPIELSLNAVAACTALHAASLAITTAMKAGVEDDFLEKIALCLYPRLEEDPHAMCPIITINSMMSALHRQHARVLFTKDERVMIIPFGLNPKDYPTDSLVCLVDPPSIPRDTDEDDFQNEGLQGA